MARKKSAFRTWLSGRRLRWLVLRAVGAVAPSLVARVHFSARSVRAEEAARHVVENAREPVVLRHSPAEARDILAPAARTDTGDTRGTAAGTGAMRYQTMYLADCAILGHTRSVVRRRDCALVNYDASPGNWNYAKPARLRALSAGPEPHVLLDGTGHFFHFFANGLMPVLRYLERDPQARITLVVPTRLFGFEAETLAALAAAFPGVTLKPLARDEKIVGAEVLWLMALCTDYEWMPVTRARATVLREMLQRHWAAGGTPVAPPTARLYLDRGEAKLRRLTDAAEVRGGLERAGFRSFVAHAGNFPEQVAAFHGAEEIVAVHGAGLTNLLFCRPGTRVIEVFPENFIKSTYFWLARQLELDYRYVIGGPGDYDQAFAAGADRLARAVTARV
ncbi:glycosyltransferase family 61 protein [Stappia sp.]|uniref:glycosyltransferase family 61 protein n=1 Tax=Stappia sp. TaxID=1870903 RepID=UPI0032D973B2